MKYIFLNLKRFDIPKSADGVNSIADAPEWAEYIVKSVNKQLDQFKGVEFAAFFPEAHIITAAKAGMGKLHLGCQSVYDEDVSKGGNFGAFTTLRTAKSMAALGCDYAIIGHCEERKYLNKLMGQFGSTDKNVVDSILCERVHRAQEAGLKVLFCVGENANEVDRRSQVLSNQLKQGLKDADISKIVIGYEPLWAIGPGRPVPTAEEIRSVAQFVKTVVDCPIVYGGGLKESNAAMIASIPEMDGGLIALTRFQGDIGFYPDEYLRIIQNYTESLPQEH